MSAKYGRRRPLCQTSSTKNGEGAKRLLVRPGRADQIPLLQSIDVAARSRYAALPGFESAAQAPAIAAERFEAGETWVAELDRRRVGFVLLRPEDDMLYLANISVVPEVSGRGVGARLVAQAIARTAASGAEALALATFRTPPWNGPWFRQRGFEPLPEGRIGPELQAILDRHARFLDRSKRETLWRRC